MDRKFQFNTIEKRKYKRFNTIILADLYSLDFARLLGRGCITNISMSGMQVETKESIAIEGEFAVKFFLPNGMKFDKITGKIMHTKKDSFTYVYGIKFTSIALVDRLRIWWFINTR